MSKDDVSYVEKMRHTASHVLAQAVLKFYPDVKLGIGPAIDNGFYYDFEFSEPLTEDMLPKIEKEMKKIIKRNLPLNQSMKSRKDTIKLLKEFDQPYKIELLEDIKDKELSFFTTGEQAFIDLCRGPHVESTKDIGPFKLMRIAGAYWRGDEKNKMLTRIYGVAFETQEELDKHLEDLEQAELRNHRRLGKQLDLFEIIPEIGQGLPVWMPRGYMIRSILEDYMLELERKFGYKHILTPHINKKELFEISGHLEFYKDSMYSAIEVDGEEYYLKPMNCPACMMVYKTKPKSYRDLPYKLGEFGTVYRYEQSGELHGLQRVRGFTQNDAHIFCMPDQLEDIIEETLQMMMIFYKAVGFDNYYFRLALSDPKNTEKYAGERKEWEKAEASLRKVLKKGKYKFVEEVGEAAFYGPKIDVQAVNVFGKEDSVSTIQLDFNLPERFDINYIDTDGKEKRAYVIHRALIGSFERFFAFLIEHHGGDFPLWFAPEQLEIVPIADRHQEFAQELLERAEEAGLRVKIDDRSKTLQARIRDAETMKIPYVVVVGDKEIETQTVSVRSRKTKEVGLMKIDEFINKLTDEAESMKMINLKEDK